MTARIKVLIAAGDALYAEAVGQLLDREAQTAYAGHLRQVSPGAFGGENSDVNVVLLATYDRAPSRQSIQLLRSAFPQAKVVAAVRDVDLPDAAVGAIEAGAAGYIVDSAASSEFVSVIVEVHHDRPPCSQEVTTAILERIRHLARDLAPAGRPALAPLTLRELQVLDYLRDEFLNKEIARELGVSLHTVKNHVHKILEKLGATTRREAVRRALEQGIVNGAPRSADGKPRQAELVGG